MKAWIVFIVVFGAMQRIEANYANSLFVLESLETENELPSLFEESSYILRFRFPSHLKVPALCGFYKGYRLDFLSDLCIIKESSSCSSFSIVITEDIASTWDGHTILRLEQIPSKKCRMFYVTKNIKKEGAIEWNVEEEARDNIPLVLPKAAIILLFNPDYIDKIDPTPQKYPSDEEVVSLPLIEIKKDSSQKELDTISNASWCASVAMRGIHRPTGSTKKNDALRLISLTCPARVQSH